MSSCGNPSTEVDALMPRKPKFDKSKDCIKCKCNPGRIVIRHAVYCKDCFIPFVTYKFRRSLDASINPPTDGTRRTNLKAPGNLLIGFSGGLGSTILLDLISKVYFSPERFVGLEGKSKGGKDHPRNVKVWKKATVCYVEVCSAFPGMRDRTDEVRATVEQYDQFDFIPLRIERAFDAHWWGEVCGQSSCRDVVADISSEDIPLFPADYPEDSIRALRSYIESLPTQTAILTATQSLIRLLLLYTAYSSDSSHLALGTSLTSLSINLISSISQGGGFVVREEAEEQWTPPPLIPTTSTENGAIHVSRRRQNVRISRPLRDVGMKECAAWAWWSGLKVIGREKIPGGKQGIGGLTRDFIIALERDYPSTVSTIARTCGKLAPKNSAGGKCALCERASQRGIQDWKARISIRSFADTDPDQATTRSHASETSLSPHISLTPYLCYACHTTLTSRSSRGMTASSKLSDDATRETKTSLPVWVQVHLRGASGDSVFENGGISEEGEVWRRNGLSQTEIKAQVADFLLDD